MSRFSAPDSFVFMKNKLQQGFTERQRDLVEATMKGMIHDVIRFIVPQADEIYDLSREITILDKHEMPPGPRLRKKDGLLASLAVKVFRWNGDEEVVVLNIIL